jgi:predicted transcriptional regulator
MIMGKMRENPRYNVVSMRISDDERIELENLMSLTDKSVSSIMREAMLLFKARLETLQMDRIAA